MPGETRSDPIADAVAGLVDLAVGPGLSAALASLELKSLTGSQCVDVLKARYRQGNHERGELFAVIAEVLRRNEAESSAFEEYPGEFAADEVRAALVLTRRAADGLCDLAESVVRGLPDVQRALAAGLLDQPRVRVFRRWTCGLSDEHTKAIVTALLPKAPKLTTAQLMHQIQRYAIALDPTWARRRYEQALKGRRVVGSRNEDGTANLAGYDLPPDQVAAAVARLDRLAKAAKQAGHPDPIDHVRSYLFLGMTDGSYEGLTDPQILARLLADTTLSQPSPATGPSQAEPADESPEGDPANHQPADGSSTEDSTAADDRADSDDPADREPTDDPSADATSFAGEAGPDGPASDDEATNGSDRSEQADDDPGEGQDDPGQDDDGPGPGDGGPSPGDGDPGPGDGGPGDGGPGDGGPDRSGAVGRGSGLRLLVRLATLAEADQRPGDLVGSGPVHAELARAMANTPGASWWYALTNPAGAPLAIGSVRSRPRGPAPGGRGYPGLHV
ncbi:MAG: 13E12 repeat family protein, partial [Sporichthyaceae bacterium]|nr:13E12 repeat family protein [Sporichthyaceae bacterium]